jgi:hypothetical protein
MPKCFVTFASRLSRPTCPLFGGETHPRAAEHRNNTTRLLPTTPLQTDNESLTESATPPLGCSSEGQTLGSSLERGRWGMLLPANAMQPGFDCLNDCGYHHPIMEMRWRGRRGFIFSTRPCLSSVPLLSSSLSFQSSLPIYRTAIDQHSYFI